MRNKIQILLLTGLLSSAAFAQDEDIYKDMYFGVGVSKTTSESDGVANGVSYTIKYDENNYKALVGKRLNENMSVELQYSNFAEADLAVDGATLTSPIAFSGNSIGVAGLYYFDPKADFSPFAKLGAHSWKLEATTGGVTAKNDGVDAVFGVGGDGKIDGNESVKYRVEFERLKADDDLDVFSMGLLFDY
jgi:hypothetical protein